MKLENYEVHLPNYSIGDKIYDKIGPVCESYGKKVWIVGGKRALKAERLRSGSMWQKRIWKSLEQLFMERTALMRQ